MGTAREEYSIPGTSPWGNSLSSLRRPTEGQLKARDKGFGHVLPTTQDCDKLRSISVIIQCEHVLRLSASGVTS
jgi:hypothetical protein